MLKRLHICGSRDDPRHLGLGQVELFDVPCNGTAGVPRRRSKPPGTSNIRSMCEKKATLQDAKDLVRTLRQRDRVLLIPWLVATFDSTGAERPRGYEPPSRPHATEPPR